MRRAGPGLPFTVLTSSFILENPSGFFLHDAPTPIEITALTAEPTEEGIRLEWRVGEAGFNGFVCLRADGTAPVETDYHALNAGDPVSGRGPYVYQDREITPGETYSYLVVGLLPEGGEQVYGPVTATAAARRHFAFLPPIPNPTRGDALMRFDLPRSGTITLEIFNLSGRRVRELSSGLLDAGRQTMVWDGRNEHGHPAASGLYLVRLRAGTDQATRRLVLLR
jgi:hypothetical protein